MLDEERVVPQMLHLQFIAHIPERDIRLLPQIGPLDSIEVSHPVDLEAGNAYDYEDHQQDGQRNNHAKPSRHAANIRGRTTGKPRLTLINLKPALINIGAR